MVTIVTTLSTRKEKKKEKLGTLGKDGHHRKNDDVIKNIIMPIC